MEESIQQESVSAQQREHPSQLNVFLTIVWVLLKTRGSSMSTSGAWLRFHRFASTEEYQKTPALAMKILDMAHRVVFTHGDFKAHNILVDDEGHISGFLDWECTGWYPEYWEFATAMRFGRNSWRYQVASILGGD